MTASKPIPKGGRDDLVKKEEDELAIIMEYLPAELTDEEISEIAAKAVDEVGATSPREMGKVMGRIIPQVEGPRRPQEGQPNRSRAAQGTLVKTSDTHVPHSRRTADSS